MASFTTYVVAAMLILLLSPARALYRLLLNYFAARKLGLPMIVMPVSPPSPLYFFLSAPLHWLLVRLPFVPDLARRMTDLNYGPKEKARIFMEYGPALVVVSPRGLLLDVADKAVVERIYTTERKGDFDRPWEFTAMLEVFGRNISTVCSRLEALAATLTRSRLTYGLRPGMRLTGNGIGEPLRRPSTKPPTRSSGWRPSIRVARCWATGLP